MSPAIAALTQGRLHVIAAHPKPHPFSLSHAKLGLMLGFCWHRSARDKLISNIFILNCAGAAPTHSVMLVDHVLLYKEVLLSFIPAL